MFAPALHIYPFGFLVLFHLLTRPHPSPIYISSQFPHDTCVLYRIPHPSVHDDNNCKSPYSTLGKSDVTSILSPGIFCEVEERGKDKEAIGMCMSYVRKGAYVLRWIKGLWFSLGLLFLIIHHTFAFSLVYLLFVLRRLFGCSPFRD